MKTSYNIAVHPAQGRFAALKKVVQAIRHQVDTVRIYWNIDCYSKIPTWFFQSGVINIVGKNRTDNGKMFFLDFCGSDELYFMGDSDIIPPPDYIKTATQQLGDRPVISYHGRQIRTDGDWLSSYYLGGHRVFSYLNEYTEYVPVDIIGTGVSVINTSKWHPTGLSDSDCLLMSDLVVSLQAAKDKIPLEVAPHPTGWFEPIRFHDNIYNKQKNKDQSQQIELVKQIHYEKTN